LSSSPRAITFADATGEEEGVVPVGSVGSVMDLHMSRMDTTLQALLAEGARALGQEVVLPEDENVMNSNEAYQDAEEWEYE